MDDKEYEEYFKHVRKEYRHGYDKMPIEELNLPLYVYKQLKDRGIRHYGEIRYLPEWKLARIMRGDRSFERLRQHMTLFEKKRIHMPVITPIETLGLDDGTVAALKKFSVNSVEELTSISQKELIKEFADIGPVRVKRIKQRLSEHGLSLKNSRKSVPKDAA